MKYALFILSLVAIILYIVGFTQVFGAIGSSSAPCAQYINNQQAYQQCISATSQQFLTNSGPATLPLGIAILAELIAWVLGLVWTVMHRRWGWFIGVLLFTPLATLLYSAFGPDGSIADVLMRRQPGSNNTPGFDALPNSAQPGLCWQCGGRVKPGSRICLNCGATQAHVEARPSMAAQMSGFNQDNANGAFPPIPHPVSAPSWSPPPPGYQQPGQPPAMPPGYPSPNYQPSAYPPPDYQQPGYQQSAYPPIDYPPPGYQQPGQPPAPGGPGWGPGYN